MYMGRDKHENEELIRYGLPEDVWFHVENLSSAHVYLRQNRGEKLEDISETLLDECAQLVKANSIEGCKKKSVEVVYTRWRNLRKTKSMESGQVGFFKEHACRHCSVVKNNAIVNALNRTKTEDVTPDLAEIQEERARVTRSEAKAAKRAHDAEEKRVRKERAEEKKQRSYEGCFDEDKMTSNAEMGEVDAQEWEDGFM